MVGYICILVLLFCLVRSHYLIDIVFLKPISLIFVANL